MVPERVPRPRAAGGEGDGGGGGGTCIQSAIYKEGAASAYRPENILGQPNWVENFFFYSAPLTF